MFIITGMPLLTWLAAKFYPYPPISMTLVLNSFVHILMYIYYYMAAIPAYKNYLWWKKYITIVQLVQFFIILTQTLIMFPQPCLNSIHRLLALVGLSFLMYMIYSFSMFYLNTYIRENKKERNNNLVAMCVPFNKVD